MRRRGGRLRWLRRMDPVAMTESDETGATRMAIARIRKRLAPLGLVEGENGAFMAGHGPKRAPLYYSAVVYSGLDDDDIRDLEYQLDYLLSYIPELLPFSISTPYRDFLRITNGLRFHCLNLSGHFCISAPTVGAPIGLDYSQMDRPNRVPNSSFGIGSMNGPRISQGKLYLTESGTVQLVDPYEGEVGAEWSSLSAFLRSEIPRLLDAYDDDGYLRVGASPYPFEPEIWEAIAEKHKNKKFGEPA